MRKQQQIRTRHRAAKLRLAAFLLAVTAVGGGLSAFATTYTWTGGGTQDDGAGGTIADTSWTNTDNWSTDDETTGYPNSAEATAAFNTATTVSIPQAGVTCGTIALGADVTFTGGSDVSQSLNGSNSSWSSSTATYVVLTSSITGTGNTLTLQNSSLRTITSTAMTIEPNLNIDTKAFVLCVGANITMSGNLTGSGDLTCGIANQSYGITFKGDNDGYSGTYQAIVATGADRDFTTFYDTAASSSNAVWKLAGCGGKAYTFGGSKGHELIGSTFYFGAIQGEIFIQYSYAHYVYEIGNRDDVPSVLYGQLGYRSGQGVYNYSDIIKIGSNVLTNNAGGCGSLLLKGGKFVVGESYGVPGTNITFLAADTYINMTTNTVDIGSRIKNSTAAIGIEVDDGIAYTISSVIPASNTAGLTKTGAGTLELTAAPAYTGTTTVSDGVLIVPANTTLTLAEGCFTTTLSDGRIMVMPTASGSETYIWTGAGADYDWSTKGNWSLNGEVPTKAPSSESATAIFPVDATMTIDTDANISNIVVNGTLTIAGTADNEIRGNEISGAGSLVMGNNASFGPINSNSKALTINVPVEFTATEESPALFYVQNSRNYAKVHFKGAFSGSGYAKFTPSNGGSESCIYFYASATSPEFTGTFTIGEDTYVKWYSGFNSASGKWVLEGTGNKCHPGRSSSIYYAMDQAASYAFGSLEGTYTSRGGASSSNGCTLTLGGANDDFELGGTFYPVGNSDAHRRDTLVKVGTGTMTFTGKGTRYWNLQEGVFYANGDATATYALPADGIYFNGGTLKLGESMATTDISTLIKYSTAAIKIDSDYAVTWTGALNANNTVAEIEKSGSGVLTLAAPAWDSTKVTVNGTGAVILPTGTAYTLGANTEVDTTYTDGIKFVHFSVATVVIDEETVAFDTLDAALAVALEANVDTITLTRSTDYALTIAAGVTIKVDVTENAYTFGGVTLDGDVALSESTEGNVTTYIGEAGVAQCGTNAGNMKWYTSFADAYAAAVNYAANSYNPILTVKIDSDFTPDITASVSRFYSLTFVDVSDGSTPLNINLASSDGQYTMSGSRYFFPANATLTLAADYAPWSSGLISGGTLNIPEGITVSLTGNYSTHLNSITAVSGAGTIVAPTANDSVLANFLETSAYQTMLKSSAWEGTLKLSGTYSGSFNPSNLANANSTICFAGFTSSAFAAGTYACGVALEGDGLTVSGEYASSAAGVFTGALTGAGAINVTTTSKAVTLRFAGDTTGFTGNITTTGTGRVAFGSDMAGSGAVIYVHTGATATVAEGATWTSDNIIVLGDLTVSGALAVNDGGIWGSGTSGNRTIRITTKDSGVTAAKFASSWNGTCVIDFAATSALDLNSFGNANTTVVLASDFGSKGYFTEGQTINPTVRLDANVTIKNGSARTEANKSDKLVTFTKLTGGAGKTLTTFATTKPDEGYGMWYAITTLDKFEGSLVLSNRSYMDIGTVNVATAPVAGTCVVPITVDAIGGVIGDLNLTVDGTASTDKLVFATVNETSGLYLAVASVDGTYYATLQAAVDAAGVSGAAVAVTEALTSNISISVPAGSSISVTLPTGSTGTITANKVTTTVGSETVDITSYYTADSLAVNSDGKIEPKLVDSVQVDFADGESTEAAVVTVEDGSVKSTFTLPGTNVKKGLYYGVGTVTDPEETDFVAVAEKQATADNQTISLAPVTLDFGTGDDAKDVLYYKWSVSDTPQVATP